MLTQVQHQFGRLFVFPVFSLVWIFLSQVLDSADAARQFTLATMFVFILFTSFSTSFYSILWNNFHEVQIAFEFNLIEENCKRGEKRTWWKHRIGFWANTHKPHSQQATFVLYHAQHHWC